MKFSENRTLGTLTWASNDGSRTVTLDLDKCDPSHVGTKPYVNAVWHGMKQKIADGAAIPRKDADGNVRTITDDMRLDAVQANVDHFHSGATDWNRKGGGGLDINAYLARLTPEQKLAMVAKWKDELGVDITLPESDSE